MASLASLPEPDSDGELTLTALLPGVDREAAVAATGWNIRTRDEGIEQTPPPTREEPGAARNLVASRGQ